MTVIGVASTTVTRYYHELKVSVLSQDVSTNTSRVSFEYSVTHTGPLAGGSWNFGGVRFRAIINGTTHENTVPFDFRTQSKYVMVSGTVTVPHAANGSLSFPIQLIGDANPGSSWFLAANASATATATTIPRASGFTMTPSSVVEGGTTTINISRASSAFTHNVTWACEGETGTIATGVATSATWTPPTHLLGGHDRVTAQITVTTLNGAATVGTTRKDLIIKKTPDYPEVGMGTPYDLRFRRVVLESGRLTAKESIPFLSATMTDTFSAAAACNLEVSRVAYPTRLEEAVVLAEVFDGSQWLHTGKLFVLSRMEDDVTNPAEVAKYTGMSYIDWLLTKAVVAADLEWPKTTAGDVIWQYITIAKQRGWGPQVVMSFTKTQSSSRTAWQHTDDPNVARGTPVSQLLDGYVSDVMMEYDTTYDSVFGKAMLNIYNPGVGEDWTHSGADVIVNLGLSSIGRVAETAPVRKDAGDKLTRVYVSGDEESGVSRERSANVNPIFGHLEGGANASGVKDPARLRELGDALLTINHSASVERTFSYDLSSNQTPTHLYPYRTFKPGDWVLIPNDGNAPERARVAQVSITRNAEGTKATVTTGDLIPSGLAATARKLSQSSGGAISGGTMRSPAPLTSAIPAAPVGITHTVDGYWDSAGAPKSGVFLQWAPIRTSMQGSAIAVDLYEVWTRQEEGNPFKLAVLSDLAEATVAPLEINDTLDIKVRGRSRAGVYGAYSDPFTITTVPPNETLAAPSTPIVTADTLGIISASWNGLIGGQQPPPWFNYVQVEISSTEVGGYSVAGQQLVSAGAVTIPDAGEGTWWVRLVGYDALNVRGAESPAVSVEVVLPKMDTREPKAPTGFTVDTDGFWSGRAAQSLAEFEWVAVTDATDDTPIDVIAYEVWGQQDEGDWKAITTTQATVASWSPFAPGSSWRFRVRAQSGGGFWGPPSSAVSVVMPEPAFELTAPTAPQPTSNSGVMAVAWDGNLTGPPVGPPPASFAMVEVEMSATSGSTGFAQIGGIPVSGGRIVVTGVPAGQTRWFRLIAVDRLGRKTGYSAVASVVSTGITVGDLDQQILDAIEDAQDAANEALDTAGEALVTADGKNRVFRQVEAPDEALEALSGGDLWFREDAEGHVSGVNMWDGTGWNPFQLVADSILVPGTVGTVAIEDGAITAPKIVASEEMWAAVLGAHKIAANEIEAGAIEAQHIAAGVGGVLDISGNAVVINAQSDIQDLSGDISDLADSLEVTQTAFSVRPDGVYITKQNSPTEFVITNEGAEIRESGTRVSWWESGQFHVRDVVLSRLVFSTDTHSTHLFEQTPAGVVVRGV